MPVTAGGGGVPLYKDPKTDKVVQVNLATGEKTTPGGGKPPAPVQKPPPAAVTVGPPAPLSLEAAWAAQEADRLRAQALLEKAGKFGTTTDLTYVGPGAARTVDAPTIRETAMQTRATVGRAAERTEAQEMLRRAAMGIGPSAAEAQLRLGLENIARQTQSMAAAGRGSERRGARRGAMLTIGEQSAQLNLQAALARAQEQQQARGAFAQFEQQSQAMQQQALNIQAQIDAAAARGDADAVNTLRLRQAEMQARAGEFSAAAENARASEVAAATQAAKQAQVGVELQTRGLAQSGELGFLGAGQTATAGQAALAAAKMTSDTQRYLLNRQLAGTRELEELKRRWAIEDVAAGRAATIEDANRQIGIMLGSTLGTAAGAYFGGPLGAAVGGGVGGALGSAAADLFSDERVKSDIADLPREGAMSLADAYADMAKTYSYKGDDRTTAGVIAQQLEKHPVGKAFVHKDISSMRSIDYTGLHSAVLAGLAEKLRGRKDTANG